MVERWVLLLCTSTDPSTDLEVHTPGESHLPSPLGPYDFSPIPRAHSLSVGYMLLSGILTRQRHLIKQGPKTQGSGGSLSKDRRERERWVDPDQI